MKLTAKQQKFCDYYIETANATESYKRAGYSWSNDNIASVEGHKLLRKPKIQGYIQDKNKLLESDRIADMKEVKEFWTTTMRNESVEHKDRLKASELIAKTNGAFLDKVEHSGGLDIMVNWKEGDADADRT